MIEIQDILTENGMTLQKIEESSVGMYCLDESRHIIYWSPAAEKLTGYSSAQMVGKACYQTGLQHVDEQGRTMCATMCPVMATIFDGKPRSQRVSAQCQDGGRKWMDVNTKPLLRDGAICGAVEFFKPSET